MTTLCRIVQIPDRDFDWMIEFLEQVVTVLLDVVKVLLPIISE